MAKKLIRYSNITQENIHLKKRRQKKKKEEEKSKRGMSHVENKEQNARHKSNNNNSKRNTSIKLSLFENGIIVYIEISINQQKSPRTNK